VHTRFRRVTRLGAAAALAIGIITASEAFASTPAPQPPANSSFITVCGGIGSPPNNWTIPCPQSPPPCAVHIGPSPEGITYLFLCTY
jgi:hypothetical protein